MLAAVVGSDGAVIVRADLVHDALMPPRVAFRIHRVLASVTNLNASLLRPIMPPASPNRLFRNAFGLLRDIHCGFGAGSFIRRDRGVRQIHRGHSDCSGDGGRCLWGHQVVVRVNGVVAESATAASA